MANGADRTRWDGWVFKHREVTRRDVTCADRREEEGDAARIILGKGEAVHKVASEKLLFAIGDGITQAYLTGTRVRVRGGVGDRQVPRSTD